MIINWRCDDKINLKNGNITNFNFIKYFEKKLNYLWSFVALLKIFANNKIWKWLTFRKSYQNI